MAPKPKTVLYRRAFSLLCKQMSEIKCFAAENKEQIMLNLKNGTHATHRLHLFGKYFFSFAIRQSQIRSKMIQAHLS